MALSILKENCYLLIKLETKNVTKITCVIIPSGAMHLPALAWACTLGPPMVYLFFSHLLYTAMLSPITQGGNSILHILYYVKVICTSCIKRYICTYSELVVHIRSRM